MRITVTGGAGYIGSILVPMLLDAGHEVVVLDHFMYGENSLASSFLNPRLSLHRMDVRDIDKVIPHLKSADCVIPLAALVGAPICDAYPIAAEQLNLNAQLLLLDSLSHSQLVVMPTTESVYGKNADVCTEETPVAPLSTYGKHKVQVEHCLMDRDNSISLRLATVFGMSPRMRLDLLINDFTFRALRDRALVIFEGKYKRTSIHVTDVARAFLHAINTPSMLGNIYNVGAVSVTKIELCEAITRQQPFYFTEADFKTDFDQRDYIVSDAKIRATGYAPKVTLEDGIRELLMGYRGLSNNRYGNVP